MLLALGPVGAVLEVEDGLVVDYVRWMPTWDSLGQANFWIMLGLMAIGVAAVMGVEYLGMETKEQ